MYQLFPLAVHAAILLLDLSDRAAYQSQKGTVLGAVSDSDLWNLLHLSVIALLLAARTARAHQRACSWSFVVLLVWGVIDLLVVFTAPIRLNLMGPVMVLLVACLNLFAGWAWSDRADTDLSQNRT
ncbi:MAG: hypothetical protein HOV78_20295 [Hamadaea sp.]|nr:hypothetical protein [Hamadaea sp.]